MFLLKRDLCALEAPDAFSIQSPMRQG